MANIKQVKIAGKMPFDAGESKELINLIGQLALPTMGIRFNFGDDIAEMKPNQHGGKTAMYNFTVHGEEAVSFDYLDRIVRLVIEAGGQVVDAQARDKENCGPWHQLKRPVS